MPMLKRDFLPTRLFAEEKDGGCIAIQTVHDLDETRWLISLCHNDDSVLGVVGWVDLCGRNVHEELQEFHSCAGFVGIRHLVQNEPDPQFLARPDFRRGLAQLAPLQMCFDLLVREPQRDAAIELVRAFPNQTFIVDHLAKPRIANGELDPWHRQMHELARSENVYCKLSGLCTEADWATWKPSDIAPYVNIALETFGPSRLLFGSDHPVCTLAGDARRVVDAHLAFLRRLSPTEFRAITHTNAVRVYGLQS